MRGTVEILMLDAGRMGEAGKRNRCFGCTSCNTLVVSGGVGLPVEDHVRI